MAWCLGHAALAVALYAGPMAAAITGLPGGFTLPLWLAFGVQAAVLALVAFVVTLPFSFSRRAYRYAVPVVTSLATVALLIDAVTYRLVSFHVNAFFFKVLVQPGALAETGVRTWQVAAIAAGAVALLALEVKAFGWLAPRVSLRHPARLAIGLLALGVVERVGMAALAFWGGPAVFAAGQVMPLQAPVRMNSIMASLTGAPTYTLRDPFSGAARDAAARLPVGVNPADVKFQRTPDIIFAIGESFRGDYLEPGTMPRLLERARDGAIFENHYSGASNTYHGMFSLLFGLQANKTEAVVGAGRRPLLFGALRNNGYQIRLVCASSADWMGLNDSVFGEVKNDLETDWGGPHELKDGELMRRSLAWIDRADPGKPVFLLVFFFGTHFDYFYPPRSAIHSPAWDRSGGSIKATTAEGWIIKNRAKNAAHEIDWKLDELITAVEAKRGRRPLVVFTGDHGEEFREKGRIGHGSAVSQEQIHVPLVVVGGGAPAGRFEAPTSHVDVVPTLLSILGDRHPAEQYSDGIRAYDASRERFVLATVGWEPRYAAVGLDTKVLFSPLDMSFGQAVVTDRADKPLPKEDAASRFARAAPTILRMLGENSARASR